MSDHDDKFWQGGDPLFAALCPDYSFAAFEGAPAVPAAPTLDGSTDWVSQMVELGKQEFGPDASTSRHFRVAYPLDSKEPTGWIIIAVVGDVGSLSPPRKPPSKPDTASE